MATIVCLRRDEVELGTDLFTKLDIVDGQQRLTTLIILLNAIRRTLDKEKKGQRRLADELSKLLVKPEGDNLLLLQTTTMRAITSLNTCAKELHRNLTMPKY